MNADKLYLTQEDLYRFGNASSSRLNHVRLGEISTMQRNGITMIVANEQGVSLFNEEGMKKSPLTGWVWEIKRNTPLPHGLRLVQKGSKRFERPPYVSPSSDYATLSIYKLT